MHFSTRNSYYLRISANTILPLYVYLDDRHVDWMSERVLQHVLADLRPLVIPKLNAEADARLQPGGPANAKRGTLDVHRGDTYQFGYFLRGTDPHAVLIKTRNFFAAPKRPARPARAQDAPPSNVRGKARTTKGKGKARAAPSAAKTRKPKGKGKGKAAQVGDDDDAISISSNEDEPVKQPPRRSKRAKPAPSGQYVPVDDDASDDAQDGDDGDWVPDTASDIPGHTQAKPITVKDEEVEPSLGGPAIDQVAEDNPTMDVELVDDEEEAKPKPILKLSYQGFNIYGRCLCVIVEPYPPIPRAASLVPMGVVAPRAPSIAPPDFMPSEGAAQRESTPLFLPEYDREPSIAPEQAIAFRPAGRPRPPVPLFDEVFENSDEEESEMVLFSQTLMSVGDHPAGIAEDNDEIDGAAFFGDADEVREF